jgi:peptidoglycan/LPS O-acetylase OafA/YrhL
MGKQSKAKADAKQDAPADGEGEVDIEAELAKLSPEQAEMFVSALELAMRKRRIMLTGYLAAMTAVLLGQVLAFIMYVHREPGAFLGWLFLVPFAGAGAILQIFGQMARRAQPKPKP